MVQWSDSFNHGPSHIPKCIICQYFRVPYKVNIFKSVEMYLAFNVAERSGLSQDFLQKIQTKCFVMGHYSEVKKINVSSLKKKKKKKYLHNTLLIITWPKSEVDNSDQNRKLRLCATDYRKVALNIQGKWPMYFCFLNSFCMWFASNEQSRILIRYQYFFCNGKTRCQLSL